MMSAEGARMAETAGGLRKHSIQFTPKQLAWLQGQAQGRGIASVASVVRDLIDEAMSYTATEQATKREVA